MFTFYIENHEPFMSLTKNCPKLDKNKSIVSRFSVFVVYKSTVSTIQKNSYVGCFSLRQWMFVFAHLSPDKIDQIAFPELEKNFLQRFCSFSVKWLSRYQEITVPNGIMIENFWHFKVSWVKAYQIWCLFIFTSIYLLTRLKSSQ